MYTQTLWMLVLGMALSLNAPGQQEKTQQDKAQAGKGPQGKPEQKKNANGETQAPSRANAEEQSERGESSASSSVAKGQDMVSELKASTDSLASRLGTAIVV